MIFFFCMHVGVLLLSLKRVPCFVLFSSSIFSFLPAVLGYVSACARSLPVKETLAEKAAEGSESVCNLLCLFLGILVKFDLWCFFVAVACEMGGSVFQVK